MKVKLLILVTYIIIILLFFTAQAQMFQFKDRNYQKFEEGWYQVINNEKFGNKIIPHRLILRLKNRGEIDKFLLENIGINRAKIITGRLIGDYFGIEIIERQNSINFAQKLAKNDMFDFVEFDNIGEYSDGPNDFYFPNQWNLDQTKLEMVDAWQITSGDPSIILAIMDSGFDYFHEDLVGNIWQNLGEDYDGDGKTIEWNGTNWVFDSGDDNDVDDDNNDLIDDFIGWDFWGIDESPLPDPFSGDAGHGTAVTGIAAATTNNNMIGIAGVAGGWFPSKGVSLMYLRNGKDGPSEIGTAAALQYVINSGANIINMSFQWEPLYVNQNPNLFDPIDEALEIAYQKNIVLVASAGNVAAVPPCYNCIQYPANVNDYVIAVGGTNINDIRWTTGQKESAAGPELDLMAPGSNGIYTTDISGIYGYSSENYFDDFGATSAAAPHISGLVGLILSLGPGLYNGSIKAVMENSALRLGNPPYPNVEYGWGRINAEAALHEVNSFPTVTIQNDFYGNHSGKIKFNSKEKESPFISKLDPLPPEPPFDYQIEALNSQRINNVDYYFQKWSDGITTNPRNILPQTDTDYSAIYKGHMFSNTPKATAYNNGRKLLRDNTGTWHLVYEDGGNIYYTQSEGDYTHNWSPEVLLAQAEGDVYYKNPCIAVSGYYVNVVYEKKEILYGHAVYRVVYHRKFLFTGEWETPIIFEYFANVNYYTTPTLVTESYNDVWVVWMYEEGLAVRHYDGFEWFLPEHIPTTTSGDRFPSIARVNEDDYRIKIVWSKLDNDIYYIEGNGTSEGWEWNEPENLTEGYGGEMVLGGPCISTRSEEIHIAWHGHGGGYYYSPIFYFR